MVSDEVRAVVGRKRTLEILRRIHEDGPLNFSTIESEIDTSSDVISDSLSILIENGLVHRDEQSTKNIQYRISKKGEKCLDLVEKIEELVE